MGNPEWHHKTQEVDFREGKKNIPAGRDILTRNIPCKLFAGDCIEEIVDNTAAPRGVMLLKLYSL
jgi:hypothetical protein